MTKMQVPFGQRQIEHQRRLAPLSSGANVAAAVQLLQTNCRGQTIVVILSDSGLKYLSTDLWE